MAAALSLESDFSNRFWYWCGASGRRYIHSVYGAATCPPLPGAVFVAVGRTAAGERVPCALGRFAGNWDIAETQAAEAFAGADEVHVHLLAGGDAAADAVLADLAAGLGHAAHVTATAGRDTSRNPGLAEPGLPLFDFTLPVARANMAVAA